MYYNCVKDKLYLLVIKGMHVTDFIVRFRANFNAEGGMNDTRLREK